MDELPLGVSESRVPPAMDRQSAQGVFLPPLQ